jgi:TP901 family phage tail tape measure protein
MGIAAMRVPTVFVAIDRFSDVVDKMTRKTSKFSDDTAAAMSRAGSKMRSVGSNMMIASGAMLGALAVPLNRAIEFEDQMASINTLLLLDDNGIKKLGDDILSMAKKTSTPLSQLTSSFYDLISAGETKASALTLIKDLDKLSIAGLGTLNEATDVQLAAMRNFGDSFSNSYEASNAIMKTVKYGVTTLSKISESFSANAGFAGALGVTGQEFLATIAGATTTKLPTSQVEVSLGSLTSAMGKTTAKKNKILYGLFQGLGVKTGAELLQKQGGFLPALMAIEKQARKSGVALQSVFGEKRASNLFINMVSNQKVIDKYNESLKSINNKDEDFLKSAFAVKEKTAKFQKGKLLNNLDELAITTGNDLVPAFIDLTSTLTPLVKQFSAFIKNNPGVVSSFAVLAVAIGVLGAAIAGIGRLFTFGAWIISTGPYIQTAILGITMSFELLALAIGVSVGWVVLAVIAGITAIIAIFYYWDEICAWFSKQWDSFTSYISDAWNNVVDAFSSGRIIEGFKNIGRVLIDVVLYPLQQIMNLASKIPGMSFLYSGVTSIQGMRDKYGVQQTSKYQKIDSAEERQTKISGGFKGSLEVNVKDKGGNVESVQKSWDDLIPIKISQTTGSSVWDNNK